MPHFFSLQHLLQWHDRHDHHHHHHHPAAPARPPRLVVLQEENERLRRDNERFVRLIDSGEWGRGRVAELVSAGEVLKGERDALLKLIQVRPQVS